MIESEPKTMNEVCEITGLSREDIRGLEAIWEARDQRPRSHIRLKDYLY